ncbi:MAG: class I SAM-dependent methyltransferase [Nitrospirae bacterium]|nr:class I SAM-dependent methyltransferase [Nitrospirota bacterium]
MPTPLRFKEGAAPKTGATSLPDGLREGETRESFEQTVWPAYLGRFSSRLAGLFSTWELDISDHLPTLAMLTVEHRLTRVVELGVRRGASTLVLLESVARLGGHVTSVDVDPCEDARSHVESAGLGRFWTFLQGEDTSPEVLGQTPQAIDHLLIDTCHLYEQTRREFEAYLPKVRPNGFITLHDTEMAGVVRAISELLEANPSYRYYNYFNSHGFGIIRKVLPGS